MNPDTLAGATVDMALADLFDAYHLAINFQKVRTLGEARHLGAIVQQNLELGIDNLAPLGVHAERRWQAHRNSERKSERVG